MDILAGEYSTYSYLFLLSLILQQHILSTASASSCRGYNDNEYITTPDVTRSLYKIVYVMVLVIVEEVFDDFRLNLIGDAVRFKHPTIIASRVSLLMNFFDTNYQRTILV